MLKIAYVCVWMLKRKTKENRKHTWEKLDLQSAEGRTRTGTLDNQRGILSPLRLL